MTTPSDDVCYGCFATCCLGCTEACDTWCMTNAFGSRSRSSQAGWCTRCCSKSFDDDEFAAPPNGGTAAVDAQPAPQQPMSDKPAGS
ncbi:hypothetical protein BD414DRAFT_486050 [Trametes punicea]|nr:hypothetical protein BD414DRAFT_486050 [Trametes punicea]